MEKGKSFNHNSTKLLEGKQEVRAAWLIFEFFCL